MAEGALHAIVTGRVQGVGFRFFVLGRARKLGLTGSVRNLPGGEVEVLARGPAERLQEFVAALYDGPALSRVEAVKVKWGAQVPELCEFTIGH